MPISLEEIAGILRSDSVKKAREELGLSTELDLSSLVGAVIDSYETLEFIPFTITPQPGDWIPRGDILVNSSWRQIIKTAKNKKVQYSWSWNEDVSEGTQILLYDIDQVWRTRSFSSTFTYLKRKLSLTDLVGDRNGWISWEGDPTCPIPEGVEYEARLRDGIIIREVERWSWTWDSDDVEYYRIPRDIAERTEKISKDLIANSRDTLRKVVGLLKVL